MISSDGETIVSINDDNSLQDKDKKRASELFNGFNLNDGINGDDIDNEKTHLLKRVRAEKTALDKTRKALYQTYVQHKDDRSPAAKKFDRSALLLLTFLTVVSMFYQAMLSTLENTIWAEALSEKANMPDDVAATFMGISDALTAMGSFLGKFMVVMSFTISTPGQIRSFIFDLPATLKQWREHPKLAVKAVATLINMFNAAYFFGKLALVANHDSIPYLQKYNQSFLNGFADFLNGPGNKTLAFTSAFLPNLVGWGNIFNASVPRIFLGPVTFILTNPAYRAAAEDMDFRLRRNNHALLDELQKGKSHELLKRLVTTCRKLKKKQDENQNQNENLPKGIGEKEIRDMSRFDLLLEANYYQQDCPMVYRKAMLLLDTTPPIPVTRAERYLRVGSDVLGAAMAAYGFWNFPVLLKMFYEQDLNRLGMSDKVVDWLSGGLGYFMLFQMILMFSITARNTIQKGLDVCFNRNHDVNLHNTVLSGLITAFWVVCLGMGAETNLYQARLAGQKELLALLTAFLSPFLIEWGAAFSLTNGAFRSFYFRKDAKTVEDAESQAQHRLIERGETFANTISVEEMRCLLAFAAENRLTPATNNVDPVSVDLEKALTEMKTYPSGRGTSDTGKTTVPGRYRLDFMNREKPDGNLPGQDIGFSNG